MRRFIAVLTFFLLFVAGKADTISRVHVYLGDSLIVDTYDGDLIKIKLKRVQLDSGDSIRFERYFGCGGRPAFDQYKFTLADPKEGTLLYEKSPYLSPEFSFSMAVVREIALKYPQLTTISGWYRPITSRNVMDGIRFVIILE